MRGENVGTPALLLVLVPPAVAGWLVDAWVVRCGWVSRGRLAAAGGVTGALALLSIDPAVAASSLLGAVAALGGVLPRPLYAARFASRFPDGGIRS